MQVFLKHAHLYGNNVGYRRIPSWFAACERLDYSINYYILRDGKFRTRLRKRFNILLAPSVKAYKNTKYYDPSSMY